ncbi:YraN family protein [Candidatus Acetothermia bacterium]|nr:YraN family protein [Candidatus Acetothermia bacterium]MBI3642522.1 YraN family protein [Candidatus Acetothermia bacterium]
MEEKAHERGIRGEDQAILFLKNHDYQIVQRNYRWRGGEIDIIARDGNCLVFVEVKFRSSESFGLPEEHVTAQKRGKIIQTAMRYLQEHPTELDLRFDVVALSGGSARLFQNAFSIE